LASAKGYQDQDQSTAVQQGQATDVHSLQGQTTGVNSQQAVNAAGGAGGAGGTGGNAAGGAGGNAAGGTALAGGGRSLAGSTSDNQVNIAGDEELNTYRSTSRALALTLPGLVAAPAVPG